MGSSHSSTHNTTDFGQNTTPTNPLWVTNGLGALGNTISSLNGLDPYSLVSGPNVQQSTAGGSALNLGGLANTDLNTAGAILSTMRPNAPQIAGGLGGPASMQAASLLPNLQSYMSPYTQDVVNSSLADYDYGAGQTQAANRLALANDATFGGSGGAIQTALSNDALTRGRATLASGLLNQGFQTGANLSNLDAERQQQASQTNAQLTEQAMQRQLQAAIAQANADQQQSQLNQSVATNLANVGSATDANTRANIAAQAGLGDDLRGITQQQNLAPISLASSLAGLWGSMPLSLLHGENTSGSQTSDSSTTQTPSALQDIMGLASAAGSVMGGLGAMGVRFGGGQGVFSGAGMQPVFDTLSAAGPSSSWVLPPGAPNFTFKGF